MNMNTEPEAHTNEVVEAQASEEAETPRPEPAEAGATVVEEAAAPATMIDTSKMSPEQRAALEMTEAAREVKGESFAGGLFMGRFDFRALHPYPEQRATDKDQGDAFLERLGSFLKENADPDEIDRTGEIPEAVFEGLGRLGAFGIKISPEYG